MENVAYDNRTNIYKCDKRVLQLI